MTSRSTETGPNELLLFSVRLIEKFVQILEHRVHRPLDVLLWFRMLTLDTFGQLSLRSSRISKPPGTEDLTAVGEMFLGTNFGGLDSEKPPTVLEDLDNVFPTYFIRRQFP